MVNQIVELENNRSYVILDEVVLENRKFYYGLRLNDKEEPTNNYLFFEETKSNDDTYLNIISDKDLINVLYTAFTINYINMSYDV